MTHWNFFTALPLVVTNDITVATHSGGYTWDEVKEYGLRILNQDRLGFEDRGALAEAQLFWENLEENCDGVCTRAQIRTLGMFLFGAHPYGETDDPAEATLEFARNIARQCEGFGLKPGYRIRLLPKDLQDSSAVFQESADLRIALLCQQAEIPRTTPALSAAVGLLERDDAIEANWKMLRSLVEMNVLAPDEQQEASHLLGKVSLLRMDLYYRNKRDGIPMAPDPASQVEGKEKKV